jgi:hypothetical protein
MGHGVARKASGADRAPAQQIFGMRDLRRLALWGIAATASMAIAAYAGTTATGRDRLKLAAAELHKTVNPSDAQALRPLDAKEGQQLAEAVRRLTADRDRLLARLATLERNIEDMTGSIARVEKAAQASQQAKSEPREAPVGTVPATAAAGAAAPATGAAPAADAAPVQGATPTASETPEVTASLGSEAVPMPPPRAPAVAPDQPATSDAVIKTEFGVDIGSASSIQGLRALWTDARRRHSAQLEGLRPIIHLRERARPAAFELRLVAGPIANAAVAARLCGAITAAGSVCQPALFDGQRLAVR